MVESIGSMQDEFDISCEAVVAVDRNNALNYMNGIHYFELANVLCLAYMLNLAVCKRLEVKAVNTGLSRL